MLAGIMWQGQKKFPKPEPCSTNPGHSWPFMQAGLQAEGSELLERVLHFSPVSWILSTLVADNVFACQAVEAACGRTGCASALGSLTSHKIYSASAG